MAAPTADLRSSSSSVTVDAPAPAAAASAPEASGGIRPFSTAAISVKVGVNGVGGDLAVPLARKFNLRVGGSAFSYNATFTPDGITVNGNLDFKTVNTSLDWFPFGGAFRLSPGVTLYNGNNISATASVPGGQTFTLNNVSYTSSTTNPVTGTMNVVFGNKVAPSLTMGFGNMIPRKGGHWSVPFEIGAEFIGTPSLALNLNGSACSGGTCTPTTSNSSFQANEAAEQTMLNNDINPLRVFPILSIGLSYKF